MSEFIAEAQVLVTPNTKEFAVLLRKQLEVAVAAAGPIAVPVVAAPAAVAETAAAQKALAGETAVATTAIKAENAALSQNVVSNEVAGVAAVQDAAAVRKQTVARSQATRAIEAQAASIAGLRGAALTASTPFLAATVAVIAFGKSIKAATSTNEELNKSVVVFGESSKQIEDFAKTTANSIGISEEEALKATGVFGNLFRSIQIGQQPAADMSQRLVELSADLASFNNADPSRVLEALRSGLVGQARPLRVFGVFLTQARAQQEALIETGKKNVNSLTNQEIVQARYNIILRDSSLAQGDFERTSERLANQTRILKANLQDLSATLGAAIIPGVTNLAKASNDLLRIFKDIQTIGGRGVSKAFEQVGQSADKSTGQLHEAEVAFGRLFHPGQELEFVLGGIAKGFDKIAGSTPAATKEISGFHFAIGGLAADIARIQAANAAKDIEDIGRALKGLEVQQLEIQTGLAPGGRGAEESNLRAQIEADKKAVAQAKSGSAARRKAIEDLHSDQAALQSLIAQDSQDIEDRARAAQDAADKATQAQIDAVNALVGGFQGRSSKLQEALSRAASNENFKKQIAINKAIISNDQKEITALKARIAHLHLHGEALKAVQEAIQTAQREIQDARAAIADAVDARNQAINDILNQKLDLRIQIAQAQGNVVAEIKARRAKLDEITKELVRAKRATGKNSVAWLELRAAQVEEIKAIKELESSSKEKQSAQKSLFFQFLQTQQGFAANLLGNLIPGFATNGLVGGGGGQLKGDVAQHPFDTGVQTQAATAASRDRGVRPVQVDTTNHLLRQILRSLQNLNGRASAPEARYQNRVAGSNMDTIGGV